jgi:hypothetical protein
MCVLRDALFERSSARGKPLNTGKVIAHPEEAGKAVVSKEARR